MTYHLALCNLQLVPLRPTVTVNGISKYHKVSRVLDSSSDAQGGLPYESISWEKGEKSSKGSKGGLVQINGAVPILVWIF